MNNTINYLSDSIRIGALEVMSISALHSIPENFIEGIMIGSYNTLDFKVSVSSAFSWDCYKPLTMHGSEIIQATDGKLTCVYCTHNMADNVGCNEVMSILYCLFDGAPIKHIKHIPDLHSVPAGYYDCLEDNTDLPF